MLRILEKADYTDSIYDIQNVKQYLAELPEEIGFVIFNEKDLEGWQGLVGNPVSRSKMDPKELARTGKKPTKWHSANGWSKTGNCCSWAKATTCVPKRPTETLRCTWTGSSEGPEADAGIYLRGSPQVQIWDTARVHVGAQVGSGGLYNNAKNPFGSVARGRQPVG